MNQPLETPPVVGLEPGAPVPEPKSNRIMLADVSILIDSAARLPPLNLLILVGVPFSVAVYCTLFMTICVLGGRIGAEFFLQSSKGFLLDIGNGLLAVGKGFSDFCTEGGLYRAIWAIASPVVGSVLAFVERLTPLGFVLGTVAGIVAVGLYYDRAVVIDAFRNAFAAFREASSALWRVASDPNELAKYCMLGMLMGVATPLYQALRTVAHHNQGSMYA